MRNFADIDQAIKAVCPIQGISFGRVDDKSTWIIVYDESATEEQRAVAEALLQTLEVKEVAPTPDPVLERLKAVESRLGITPIGVLGESR